MRTGAGARLLLSNTLMLPTIVIEGAVTIMIVVNDVASEFPTRTESRQAKLCMLPIV